MRTRITFFLMLTISCITAYAAVYVKGNHHFDSYYSGGVIHPEADLVNEWWFDRGKVSFVTIDWRLTLDKQKQRILVVNKREKTYTEIPLPLKLSSHLDQSLLEAMKDYSLHGTIKAMNKKETVNRKTCDVYTITEWIIFQKNRFYDRDRTIKISTDVPFDWQLLDELHQWVRSYFNPQPVYLSGLKKLQGFVLSSKELQFSSGTKFKWNFKVVEINNNQAPGDIFMIPKDFKKKEKLSREDLINIRGTIYVYP